MFGRFSTLLDTARWGRLQTLSILTRNEVKSVALSSLEVQWLGKIDYLVAWDLQRAIAERRLSGEVSDTLLLLEHPPTFTFGRSADPANLLASVEELEAEGFAIVHSDRGGDITYHGEGQIVGYPILNLREPPHAQDLHRYLRDLEEVLIRTLACFGVEAARFAGYTGVWVGMGTPTPEKIAAIGVKASRWITQHGFALNVSSNLSHYEKIVPCGIRGYGVTSLERLTGRAWTLDEVILPLKNAFCEVFGYEIKEGKATVTEK